MSEAPAATVYCCFDFEDREDKPLFGVHASALGAIKCMEKALIEQGILQAGALPKILYAADRGTFGIDWYLGDELVLKRGVIVRREVGE